MAMDNQFVTVGDGFRRQKGSPPNDVMHYAFVGGVSWMLLLAAFIHDETVTVALRCFVSSRSKLVSSVNEIKQTRIEHTFAFLLTSWLA